MDDSQALDSAGKSGRYAIAELNVTSLHGKYNYDVVFAPLTTDADSNTELFAVSEDRLSLLYGGNGSGKTSLLSMLFHALSFADDRGHRSTLATIKFREFKITFVDGSWVRYFRDQEELSGGYLVETEVDGIPRRWRYQRGTRNEEDEANVLGSLQSMGLNPAFLSDTRAFTSDLVEREAPEDQERLFYSYTVRQRLVDEMVSHRRNADLASALTRVRRYLSELILQGEQRGSQRVDQVYVDLVRLIVEHSHTVGRPRRSTLPDLHKRIERTQERATQFAVHGLIPEFPRQSLLDGLTNARPSNARLLEHVLAPYLDGLDQRMDALEPGRRAISVYTDTVNGFLHGKSLSFRMGRGTFIRDSVTGEVLRSAELSSGEKQVLLLFANLIAMRGQSKLFIIDEPELSLNPGWQRQLIPALLRVTNGSDMQLIIATHSIEIMAKYRSRLRHLA